MRQLFHTPEGVRDVYGTECAKKLYLQRKMEKIFHAYGYQSIETPTFEFFDVFGKQVGTTPSRELYKFLTAMVIPWCFVRTLHLPSRERHPCIIIRKICRSVSATAETRL